MYEREQELKKLEMRKKHNNVIYCGKIMREEIEQLYDEKHNKHR